MIYQQAFILTLINMITHRLKNTDLYSTLDAEHRGILSIKTSLLLKVPKYQKAH